MTDIRDIIRTALPDVQCLDFDFVTQGDTVPEVLRSLARCIEMQTEWDEKHDGRVPFSDYKPAPDKYWRRAGYDR